MYKAKFCSGCWNSIIIAEYIKFFLKKMRKINISIVGIGLMGLQHIKAISKSKKANLHSIVDISTNAKKLSKKFNVPLYSSVDELVN